MPAPKPPPPTTSRRRSCARALERRSISVIPASETARIIPPQVAEAPRHFIEGSTEQALAALQAAGTADGESVPLQFMTALLAWRLGDAALALPMSRACFEREP